MKIKIVSNYGSDAFMYETVNNCFENKTTLKLTKDEDYDYLIVINGTRTRPRVSRDKIIGILQEPIGNINYDRNLHFYCSKIICQSKSMFGNYHGIIEKFLPMFYRHHESVHRDYFLNYNTIEERKKLCIIISSINYPNNPKWTNHNYSKRHRFVESLLRSDLDFDFYGNGWNLNDERYKGSTLNKHETLRNYEYSIAIENVCEKNYVSEKFFDCILNNTVPLYYGAPNVSDFYDPFSYKEINIDKIDTISEIKNLISTDSNNYLESMIRSKNNYFQKSNLFQLIDEAIRE
jgi:hypothetical protein